MLPTQVMGAFTRHLEAVEQSGEANHIWALSQVTTRAWIVVKSEEDGYPGIASKIYADTETSRTWYIESYRESKYAGPGLEGSYIGKWDKLSSEEMCEVLLTIFEDLHDPTPDFGRIKMIQWLALRVWQNASDMAKDDWARDVRRITEAAEQYVHPADTSFPRRLCEEVCDEVFAQPSKSEPPKSEELMETLGEHFGNDLADHAQYNDLAFEDAPPIDL